MYIYCVWLSKYLGASVRGAWLSAVDSNESNEYWLTSSSFLQVTTHRLYYCTLFSPLHACLWYVCWDKYYISCICIFCMDLLLCSIYAFFSFFLFFFKWKLVLCKLILFRTYMVLNVVVANYIIDWKRRGGSRWSQSSKAG